MMHKVKYFKKFSLLNKLRNWVKSTSINIYCFTSGCCGNEILAILGPLYDSERLGINFVSTPERADLIMVSGTITEKMKPILEDLYNKFGNEKVLIAVGSCAINGGPFYKSDFVLNGIKEIFDVDLYLPGCPPRPEAIINVILKYKDYFK
jgi:NADH-quinone oxidoreductase subunit B